MELKEIREEHIGRKISCYIRDVYIEEALVIKEAGKYFILNNLKDGMNCLDKKGYKYSWTIEDGSSYYMTEQTRVTDIHLLHEIHELWL